MKLHIGLTLTCAVTLMASTVLAASPNPLEQHTSNALWFESWEGLSNATMTVIAPDGTIDEIFAATSTPVYRLPGNKLMDGIYRYELSAATSETEKIVNAVDNGRGEQARNEAAIPFYMEGSFVVSRGVIIVPEEIQEDGAPYTDRSGDAD